MIDDVRLLGRPAVRVGGDLVEVPPSRASAVWLYLARQGHWVARDELLYLLWPDTPQDRAATTLRQHLQRLVRSPLGARLERERRRLRVQVPTDVAAFLAAADEGRRDDALARYGGAFLDGFAFDEAPEYEAWRDLERSALHERFRGLGLDAVARHLERGEAPEAVAVAERLVTADPLDEEASRSLIVALRASGDASRARRVFAALETTLRETLGVAPEAGVRAALEARLGTAAGVYAVAVRTALTTETVTRAGWSDRLASRLVGRSHEVGLLEERLGAGARLVSVVAPAGMGKSWLAGWIAQRAAGEVPSAAQEWGRRGEAGFEGVSLARLEDVGGRDGVVRAIATGLGLRLEDGVDPFTQLVVGIGGQRVLLVLDAFEDHLDQRDLVADLLAACPSLHALVTSRAPLRLSDEHVLVLDGLATRSGAAGAADHVREPQPGVAGAGGAAPVPSDAARAFLQARARLHVADALQPPRLDLVEAIVERLDGVPLAIDLCAAWSSSVPLDHVLAGISQGWEFLTGDDSDRRRGHEDVRGLLAEAWQALDASVTDAWARLSCVDGSLDADLARRLAGGWAPVKALRQLGLARPMGDRVDLHTLVARFGRERAEALGLAGEVDAALVEAFLVRLDDPGRIGAEPVHHIHDDDVAHLVRAWRAAVAAGDAHALRRLAVPALRALNASGRLTATGPLADAAVSRLSAMYGAERDRALARLLPEATRSHGTLTERCRRALELAERRGDALAAARARHGLAQTGRLADARAALPSLIAAFDEASDPVGVIEVCLEFGGHLALTGHYDDAEALFERALRQAQRLGSPLDAADAHDGHALVALLRGRLDDADRWARQALERFLAHGAQLRAGGVITTLGWIARVRRAPDAFERTEEGVRWLEDVGLGDGPGVTMTRLHALFVAGRYADVMARAASALDHLGGPRARHIGADVARLMIARAALRTGASERALDLVRLVLRADDLEDRHRIAADAAVAVAEWLVAERRTGDARSCLDVALRHPGLDVEARQEAETLAARLPDGLRDGASERLTTTVLARALRRVVDGQPLVSGTVTGEG